MTILAATPIFVILVLMIVFRWGAARAGAAGYLTALAAAIVFFGATANVLAVAHIKSLILSLDVLLIIWAAYVLYRITDEAGAIKIIGDALPQLTPDKGMQAILIGWVFASFLQGAGGFGVPVAVTAPLLVGLGFNPLAAVVIPSVGHGWAVTFGSLGSSFQALMSATGLDNFTLAPHSALFLGIAAIASAPLVAHAADGWQGIRRLTIKATVIGFVMAGVQYLVALAGLWNISAFLGGLAGLIVSVPLARWRRPEAKSRTPLERKSIFLAVSAYVVLIILTVIILMIPAVRFFMGQVTFSLNLPQTTTALNYTIAAEATKPIKIFTHAGAILLYTSVIAYWLYLRVNAFTPGAKSRIISSTAKGMMSSSLSILLMVAMATIMQQSGMTEQLASGLAQAFGAAYPVVAPWIGGIGAFMTGSNTNSNVVFGALQMRTAELLQYSVPIILAAQTAGAALASVAAPTKVIVGASTAGMAGREGEILRALIIYVSILVLLISFLTVLFLFTIK